MSKGIAPLFTSAPRLQLRIDDNVLAYAIGFNMNVAIDIQPVQVLGQFDAASLEPTVYNVVTGTMQIVRLLSDATRAGYNTAGNGNGWTAAGQAAPQSSASNSVLSSLKTHLDPAKVLVSRTFDMNLYLTVPTVANLDANVPAAGTLNGTPEVWLRIKNCRLVSRNGNISQGQLVNEPVNFQGLLATPVLPDGSEFALDPGTIAL